MLDRSCCESPVISGGTFARAYDKAADAMYPDNSNPATLSAFRLDKYELTVGRFRQFVASGGGTQANPPAAGAGAHANTPGSGWDASFSTVLDPDTAASSQGSSATRTFSENLRSVAALALSYVADICRATFLSLSSSFLRASIILLNCFVLTSMNV